jgi:hypothetical protein
LSKLYNHKTNQHQELTAEEEAKFGTDPAFVSQFVPQDKKTQDHYHKLVGTGISPHAAAMMATSSHLGKVDPAVLTETTKIVADIARRHTQPGPNGGTWDATHVPGAGTTAARGVVTHQSSPEVAAEPTKPRPRQWTAPKPRAKAKQEPKVTVREETNRDPDGDSEG